MRPSCSKFRARIGCSCTTRGTRTRGTRSSRSIASQAGGRDVSRASLVVTTGHPTEGAPCRVELAAIRRVVDTGVCLVHALRDGEPVIGRAGVAQAQVGEAPVEGVAGAVVRG